MRSTRRRALALLAAAPLAALPAGPAPAAEAEVIEARVGLALERLYAEVPGARDLADRARAMLIMPRVVKGGLLLGGSYGEGALRLNEEGAGYGPTVAYYSVAAASLGLQAGVQETSHVLFFLTDPALDKFRRSDGWEIGADAEITALDTAVNLGIDSTAFETPVVAIVFGGSGLMLGASLEGAKYSRIER
jgi:lipid-binding SYLF domain-containing protein